MSGKLVENEAELEEDQNDEQQRPYRDSSEEEDDQDNYEKDDFIVSEEEVLSDEDRDLDSDKEGPGDILRQRKKDKRKRRKYRDDSPELADGDIQLLEEGGVHVNRKKKLRRLRKGASDDEQDDIADELRDLNNDYDDEEEQRHRVRDDDRDFDFEDEMDDFIDDGGRGRRRRAAERKGLVSSAAVRDARTIFGDNEDILHYKSSGQYFQEGAQPGAPEAEELGDDDDEDFLAGGDDDHRPRPRRHSRREQERRDTDATLRAMAAASLADDGPKQAKVIERFVNPDIPERLVVHFGKDYSSPSAQSRKDRAQWIYTYGMRDDPNVGALRMNPEKVVEKIAVFLEYVHKDKLDVPFIAMYRKDYISPELVCEVGENHQGNGIPWNDQPPPQPSEIRGFNSYEYDGYRPGLSIEHLRGVEPGYDDGFGDWSVLWKIMDWDKKFTDMHSRRQRLKEGTKIAQNKGVPMNVIDQVVSLADLSENELQLADCERSLRLSVELASALRRLNLDEDEDLEKKNQRRPSRRKVRYADFCAKGYRELAELYGLSSAQFAENVHNAAVHGPEAQYTTPSTADEEPLESARSFGHVLRNKPGANQSLVEGDPSRLLSAARLILVKEMSSEILVVQRARMILAKEGTVTVDTNPTPLGLSDVDDVHPLRPVTFFSGKKLERFANSVEYSLVMRAVNLGFTKVTINFQEEQVHQFSQILQNSFHATGVMTPALTKWNAERKLVADEVLQEMKMQIRREIHEQLLEKTNETLKRQMSQSASRRLLLGPCRPYPNEQGAPVVLAICVTREEDEEPDKNQSRKDAEDAQEKGRGNSTRRVAPERLTFVVVDENGEYVSSQELFAGWLRRPLRTSPPEAVQSQLKSFIVRMKPQLIVVGIGSGGKSATRLKDDIRFVLHDMLNSDNLSHMFSPERIRSFRSEKEQMNDPSVAYRYIDPFVMCVDEWPAKAYAHCKAASIGLPVDGMTLLEKRAIALARLAQEPVTVYAGICCDRDVAKKFKLHPYHYFVKVQDRIEALTRALIRGVCTTGVDINRVLTLPHMKPLVQYVGGLGEHKADKLVRDLEQALSDDDKGLGSRKQLWNRKFLGRTVFVSAAAFLRVRDPELHNGGSTSRAVELRKRVLERRGGGRRNDDNAGFYDPMDDSRIHPEHYAVAIKIADEALRDDQGQLAMDLQDADGNLDATRVTSAVLDTPEGLRRLALDEYAEQLFRLGRGRLYETVKLIAREFHGTFADHRRPLTAPTPQAMFYMVTGADPMTLRLGSRVTATNCRIAQNGEFMMCMLPHDIQGSADRFDLADEALTDEHMKQLITEGSSMACRIHRFDYDKFRAKLTSKPSILKDPSKIEGYVQLVNTQDACYRPYPVQATGMGLEGASAQNARDGAVRPPTAGSNVDEVRRRKMSLLRSRAKPIVNHRLFRDISGPEAVETLRNALPGDVIIRPSVYNKDSFVFSSKFASLPAIDGGTPRDVFHIECKIERDPTHPDSPIRITIGSDVFEHIDEALEQFLNPIITNLKDGLEHRKFQPGGEHDLKKLMAEAKRNDPKSIPYCVGLSDKLELHMFIAYVPGTSTPRTEYIRVVPHGYKLRDVLHQSIEKLCLWFKKNMTKGMNVVGRSNTSSAIPASPFAAPGTPRSETIPLAAGATPVFDAPPPIPQGPFAQPVQNGATPVADMPPPPGGMVMPGPSPGMARPGPVPSPGGFGGPWNGTPQNQNGYAPSHGPFPPAQNRNDFGGQPPPRNNYGGQPPQRDNFGGPRDQYGEPGPNRGQFRDEPMRDVGPGPGMGRGGPPPMGRGGPGYGGPGPQFGPPGMGRGRGMGRGMDRGMDRGRGRGMRGMDRHGNGRGGDMPARGRGKPIPAWASQSQGN